MVLTAWWYVSHTVTDGRTDRQTFRRQHKTAFCDTSRGKNSVKYEQFSSTMLRELLQRIRGFTTIRYINRLFTYLLTYHAAGPANEKTCYTHNFIRHQRQQKCFSLLLTVSTCCLVNKDAQKWEIKQTNKEKSSKIKHCKISQKQQDNTIQY